MDATGKCLLTVKRKVNLIHPFFLLKIMLGWVRV
jgi:hypothetical protein